MDPLLFEGLYGELDDCKLFVICNILLKGGAILEPGVFGSPLMSNGSSLVGLLVDIISGDGKFGLFAFIFDERGDAAGTLCDVRWDGGP